MWIELTNFQTGKRFLSPADALIIIEPQRLKLSLPGKQAPEQTCVMYIGFGGVTPVKEDYEDIRRAISQGAKDGWVFVSVSGFKRLGEPIEEPKA